MATEGVFVDTSAWYAFYDRRDLYHERLAGLMDNDVELWTSAYIIDELITLFRVRKVPISQFRDFIEAIWTEDICGRLPVTPEIEQAAWRWLQKYADHPFSFTDCVSFALMWQHRIKTAYTLEHHFRIAGFEARP